jgi:hypothetical protein
MIGFLVTCSLRIRLNQTGPKDCARNAHKPLDAVTIDASGSAPSAPVAHHFPAIVMVHSSELPTPDHLAPIMSGDQQHGDTQTTQTHDDSRPRFGHATLLDCATDQAIRVIRRSGYERRPSEKSVHPR